MSTGMPELGSKISLISKADIRYEGRLFTVDPAECTIALANVRSYGTEDRETQFPISPQNQVYDYILFRGSDIKDIRVVNNVPAMPNDPAIMQMQLPPQHMGQQPFQPPQFGPGPMGHMGAQMGPFGAPYGPMPMGGLTASGLAPGSMTAGGAGGTSGGGNSAGGLLPPKTKQASELNITIPQPIATAAELKDQASVLELIGGGSRSTTPVSLNSRKSPTADMGVQVNKSGAGGGVGGSSGTGIGNTNAKDMSKRNNQNRGQQRERKDSGKHDNNQAAGSSNNITDNRNQRNINTNQQNNRGWNNQNRGNMRGNRNRGRGPPMQQMFRQNLQNNKGRPKTTIRFESDYDFEQANNKFEELRMELSKLKVNEEAKPDQVNGEVDKKDDSGNETGAGDHEQEEDEVTVGYDKTKSFFDNISCEAATDRSKGKNRTDWRLERKINSETFGVSSARRGNFYYRGRGGGGYFNRNMGGYHRGSGNGANGGNQGGGYRTSGNFRGRNFNRNFSGGTGIPQQPNKAEQKSTGSSAITGTTTPTTTATTTDGGGGGGSTAGSGVTATPAVQPVAAGN